jgi:hexosaminidase
MRARRAGFTVLLAFLFSCDGARHLEHNIVPLPQSVVASRGSFRLDATTVIAMADGSDQEARRIVDGWADRFRAQGARPLPISDEGELLFRVSGSGEAESYTLDVSPSGIEIVGADHAGLFYGLQTLSQLLPASAESGQAEGASDLDVPAVQVADAPRFPYRGMHLDVARHFFEPEFVKRYIDLLARYKINRFHWHLTDDQGWRIQIDSYPRLTEISAFREQTQIGHGSEAFNGDGQRYGGFYTKDEIRDIVAYAQERYVTIIPEIEMPGHSQAALAAYPQLGCTDGPFEVAMTWGVFEDIYCPYEETFEFLETVLSEVIELFPGEYIHIGGDEAPKTSWEDSEFVQRFMQREGYIDEIQVQGWFVRRIERFLKANGKRLIGWDETLEGGLPPDATVMSYRGTVGGIAAARQGHDVVMTPESFLYFDYYQSEDVASEPFAIGGLLPLEKVYTYDPVPPQLRELEASHIIGAQANVWSEYMKTTDHVEYMVFPRLFALSEVVWSPAEARSYDGFLKRIPWHFDRLDALGVNYRALVH